MSDTHEEATPFVGDITAHWCPKCLKSTLMKAAIFVLVSTGPRRIGEWAVCEGCGHSPYADADNPAALKEENVRLQGLVAQLRRERWDARWEAADLQRRLDAASELTRHYQEEQ